MSNVESKRTERDLWQLIKDAHRIEDQLTREIEVSNLRYMYERGLV